jgi:hypothetical protein
VNFELNNDEIDDDDCNPKESGRDDWCCGGLEKV